MSNRKARVLKGWLGVFVYYLESVFIWSMITWALVMYYWLTS